MKPKSIGQLLFAGVALFVLAISSACSPASVVKAQTGLPQYYSPLKDAMYVSPADTIIVRYGPQLTQQNVASLKFEVTGSSSGPHAGQAILADDQKTVIFKPTEKFQPGEQVQVVVNAVRLAGQRFDALSYQFNVAAHMTAGEIPTGKPPKNNPKPAFPNFLTVPQDIPHYTFQRDAPATGEGDIFIAPFYWTGSVVGSYLLILNEQGQLVYYKPEADEQIAFDFKAQPNGLLSYFDNKNDVFHLLDSHYAEVGTYAAGNGYKADLHDLQILPDGNALLMAYDNEVVDMSSIVPGGKKDATVTGLVIQEMDPDHNVIFQWRSWDHFQMTDSTSKLTDQNIDLIHGNALALANDGNLLLSCRNLSSITKINLQTGDIIWRLGGKVNQFKFVNGSPFAYQHDVRQLPNGDITVFDNGSTQDKPLASHAMEISLDTTNMVATVVWDFVHNPPVFGMYMGNNARLPDGNTFISWGAPFTGEGFEFANITELSPSNQPIFEMAFDIPYVSYRAFIMPWEGTPIAQPDLAFKSTQSGLVLGYSWNGATDVASWKVYGGSNPQSLSLIETKARADFETQSNLSNLPANECYFQVAALDKSGNEMDRSKVISTDHTQCPLNP